jgi:CRP-like cAMP-binding protein
LVVRQGDPCDSVYFVLSGELRVRLLVGVVDRVDKTLCKLGRGEFFGELGMFLRSKRTADVIAESTSRLFCIYTNAFQLLIKQIPELASPILFSIGTTMAQRVADDNQRLYREMTSQFVWA